MAATTNQNDERSQLTLRRLRKLIWWFVVVSGACVLGHIGGNVLFQSLNKADVKVRAPELTVPDKELELGRVYATTAYEHAVHITNPTDQPLTLVRFEKTCDCLGITPGGDVTLPPHETRSFTIKLQLLPRQPRASLEGGEPFQVRFGAVFATDAGTKHSASWPLKCVIVPTIRLRPALVRFGTESCRQAMIEQSVVIEANKEIQWIDHEAPRHWTVEIAKAQESPEINQFRAVIRSRGQLVPRKVSELVRFYPVGRHDDRMPAAELQILGEISQDVAAFPPELHYGRQSPGHVADEVVRLRSRTGRPFRVTEVASLNRDPEVKRLESKDDDWVFSLRLRFTKPGDQEVVAEFAIREEDGTEYRIAVPARYYGLAGR